MLNFTFKFISTSSQNASSFPNIFIFITIFKGRECSVFSILLQKQCVCIQDWSLHKDKIFSQGRGRWALFYFMNLLTLPAYFEVWPWASPTAISVCSVYWLGYPSSPVVSYLFQNHRELFTYSDRKYLALWCVQYVFTYVGCYIKKVIASYFKIMLSEGNLWESTQHQKAVVGTFTRWLEHIKSYLLIMSQLCDLKWFICKYHLKNVCLCSSIH